MSMYMMRNHERMNVQTSKHHDELWTTGRPLTMNVDIIKTVTTVISDETSAVVVSQISNSTVQNPVRLSSLILNESDSLFRPI